MNIEEHCRCPGCGMCEAARVRRGLQDNILTNQLLDLITLMPDSQTQEIVDYIMSLRETRKKMKE